LTSERLRQILDWLPDVRIAVVGDFFLDRYWDIDPSLAEVSLETGLNAHQIVGVRVYPGAAGTVTSNLRALGVGTVLAVGVVGEDGEGADLRRALAATGVDASLLLTSPDRFTPTYTKPMRRADGAAVEMERFDTKNRRPMPVSIESEIIDSIRALSDDVDAIIAADQVQERNCGVVTDAVREGLGKLPGPAIVAADSRLRIGEFRGVHAKANRHEALAAAGADDPDSPCTSDVGAAGCELARRNGKTAFVTLGDEGVLVCRADGCASVPGIRVDGPIDIVGAGDACMSGIVSALCAGAGESEAAELGNLVAAITITKLGVTGTASPAEILALSSPP
jgi:bifunctional ADP-heptose synthase (sugar kinase/adenylyltransferase)